jgi:hypothetical protein
MSVILGQSLESIHRLEGNLQPLAFSTQLLQQSAPHVKMKETRDALLLQLQGLKETVLHLQRQVMQPPSSAR